MLTSLLSSDFDPSGFDVGDDTWAWLLPVFSKKKEAPRPEKAASSTGTPTTAPSPRPPPLTLSISTPWMWLSTPIDGGGGFDLAMGATSPAAIPTVTPRTSPTTTSSSIPLVADSNEGEASLSSRLSSFLGLGAAEGRDAVLQDDAWAEAELAELEIIAEALGNPSPVPPTAQASSHTATPAAIATTIAGLPNGVGNSDDDDDESGGRMVQLDIAAVQALQRALQRGGFLTRGSQGLSVDSPYAFSEGGAGVGGRRPQRQSSGRSSLSVEGGTGAGGGYYSYAPGGGVMAYFDDGVDGDGRQRRSRLLLPAPPVGRHEAALVWKLFRLARDATALRVHRGTSRRASNWGQPVELQMFPALQELRLEAVPLEHVEGLFALRLQLKSLNFENAFLPSLLALLTPPEPASGSQDTAGGEGGHAAADTAADGGVPGPSIADSGGDVNKRDGADSTPVGVRTADRDRYRLSCKRGKIQQVRAPGGVASSRKTLGVSRPAKHLAGSGGVRKDETERPGMGRLQSGLGMGTPMLHWSLLESLSVRKCGLRELDPSLRLLPRVRRLSLANNRLSRVDFLQDCGSLEVLDLSHNRLSSVENIHAVLGNLRSLKLRGNLIARTSGLEKLFSLEDVNLSDNRIEDLKEAARLSTLPMLRRVWLNGNPVEAEEGKDYRVSVLSLLYQGRGGELKGAAGRISTMLAGGSGDGSGRETGIALDGRLPSRKELVQLSQLCFPRAAEVPFPTATDSALPSSDEHGSSRDGLPSRRQAPGSVVAARGRAEGTGKRRLSATAVQPAVGSSAASASRAAPDPSPSSSPSSRRRLSVSPPASRLPPPSPCVPLRLPTAQRRRRPLRRNSNDVPAAGMRGQDPEDQQARRRRRPGTRSAMIEEAAPARAGGWGGGAGGDGNNRTVSLGTASWSAAAAAEAAELSSSLSALSLGLGALPLPSEGGQQQPLLQPRETASTAVDPEVVPEAVCDDRNTTTAPAAVEGGDSSGNERRSADMGRLAPCGAEGEARGAAELARGDGGVVPPATTAAAAVALPERGEGSGELHPTVEDGGRGDLAAAAAAAAASPSGPDDLGAQRGGENDSRQCGDASPSSAKGGAEGGQSAESSSNAGGFSVGVNPAPGWDLPPGRRGRPRSGGGREVAASRASPFFPSPSPLPSPSRSPLRLLAAARQEEGGIRPPGVDGDVSGGGGGGERGSSEAAGDADGPAAAAVAGAAASGDGAADPVQQEKNHTEGGGVEGESEVEEGNEEEPGCGGVNGEEERENRGSSSVADEDAEHDCGYRGDEAYAELLVAEHLELYFRQQVFSGAAPYLLYDEERDGGGQQPKDLPRAMHRHREASKTRQEKKLVAMFRETALPCVPLSLRNQRHHHHHHFRLTTKEKRAARSWLRASWAPSPSPTVAGGVSGGGGGGAEGLSGTKTDESSSSYHGSGLESSMENALAATGMVQQVHRRGVDGEAEGYTMGEVACVVVATESSIFFVDGGFAKDGTQFSAAPRPRVLMVLPLACLERTTIGFRLQKLEMHFDPSAVGEEEEGWSDDGQRDETVSVSVALLTRDKSRTFNLLQTLEPLSTKARRRISRPAMVVENRDEATLEAIARALPPSTIASARHSTSRSQLGQASPPAFSPAGATTTPAGESEAAQRLTNIEPDLPGHEAAGLFGRLGKWGDDLGPAETGDEDGRGCGAALGSVHGGGAVTDDGNGQGGREGEGGGDKGEVAGAGEGADAAETHDTASWDLVGAPPSLSGTATPLLSPTVSGSNVVETPPSVLERSGDDVGGGGGGGGHEGTVVVFQLLVQRWELRPWVVVPRTLVATKEKLALMDEDHSRVSSSGSSGNNSNSVFGGLAGEICEDGRRLSWTVADGGEGGGSEFREMSCVDSVDLGDVIDVRQEKSAPEQVVVDLKGERAFDPRRQWRLQCRTRGSAEGVASAVLRLSRERVQQRRQSSSWWKL